MRGLSKRESGLLLLCGAVIFIMANIFVGLKIHKTLGGGDAEIKRLQEELADNRMYLEEKDLWDQRRAWMNSKMPAPIGSTLNAQGALAQTLQDDLLDRKIKIERQSLQEPVTGTYYEEVAVNLRLRGEAAKINEWLSTLQEPEKFQVIKNLSLELDTKSKEPEPQAVCNVTVARWFTPKGQAVTPPAPVASPEPVPEPEPEPATETVPETPVEPDETRTETETPPVEPENTETNEKENESKDEGNSGEKKVELT